MGSQGKGRYVVCKVKEAMWTVMSRNNVDINVKWVMWAVMLSDVGCNVKEFMSEIMWTLMSSKSCECCILEKVLCLDILDSGDLWLCVCVRAAAYPSWSQQQSVLPVFENRPEVKIGILWICCNKQIRIYWTNKNTLAVNSITTFSESA